MFDRRQGNEAYAELCTQIDRQTDIFAYLVVKEIFLLG